jgi:hypothetical protein
MKILFKQANKSLADLFPDPMPTLLMDLTLFQKLLELFSV